MSVLVLCGEGGEVVENLGIAVAPAVDGLFDVAEEIDIPASGDGIVLQKWLHVTPLHQRGVLEFIHEEIVITLSFVYFG